MLFIFSNLSLDNLISGSKAILILHLLSYNILLVQGIYERYIDSSFKHSVHKCQQISAYSI
jgi:hypothetical protein